jgi:23S rRNA (guanosine2251-2'-O)-methyltransferase
VYGRQAVREALRGRREVVRVWCSAAARRALDWLPEGARVTSAERLDALAQSPDHQGVVAEAGPYPYADPRALLAGDRPLVVALDEVTDPHNLGAVARVAECAGADGLLVTRRRSAAVTGAVCKASAGAVEHLPIARVENLADLLIAARRPGLWSYAATGEGDARHRIRAGRRGPGAAAARTRGVRRGGRDPDAGPGGVAQRVDGGGGAGVRGRPPARWLTRSSSSTATT